jgi:hypothetical protein
MDTTQSPRSARRAYIWIIILLGIILCKGVLTYAVVSDQGQPSWDYRPVQDVPAQSPYAVYPLLPAPQHVRGAMGE